MLEYKEVDQLFICLLSVTALPLCILMDTTSQNPFLLFSRFCLVNKRCLYKI